MILDVTAIARAPSARRLTAIQRTVQTLGRSLFSTAVDPISEAVAIHEGFDRQAWLTPDASAVIDRGRHVSYVELRRAAQIVTILGSAGIPVAALAERCLDAVVGIVGILKAGDAYVAINPQDPNQRLTAIIDDAKAPAVLAQSHVHDRCPASRIIIDLKDASGNVGGRSYSEC